MATTLSQEAIVICASDSSEGSTLTEKFRKEKKKEVYVKRTRHRLSTSWRELKSLCFGPQRRERGLDRKVCRSEAEQRWASELEGQDETMHL